VGEQIVDLGGVEGGEGGRPATRRGRARGDGGFPPGTLEAALADAEAGNVAGPVTDAATDAERGIRPRSTRGRDGTTSSASSSRSHWSGPESPDCLLMVFLYTVKLPSSSSSSSALSSSCFSPSSSSSFSSSSSPLSHPSMPHFHMNV
jgi:hypothetical protein